MKATHSSTPATLKSTCTTAARSASRGFPIDASSAVTQVPMLAPKMNAIPVGSEMSPWLAITITMPVVADDDCTSAVNAADAAMPTSGDSIVTIQSRNGW